MEKTVSLETAINSRTTYAMPDTARHFGIFDPTGVPVDRATVERISTEGLNAARLFGRVPKVHFSTSSGYHNIEASLPITTAAKIFRRFGYGSYFTLGAFVQGMSLLCAARSKPLAECVVGGFKPYAPKPMSLERIVLKLCIGEAKKSYPYGSSGELMNTDYHTSKKPEGWVSGNLPDPHLKGELSLSDVIYRQGTINTGSIKRKDVGQVLWAGYGSTPHWTHRAILKRGTETQVEISKYCQQGKSVPSWNAEYGLELYVSFDGGIYKYVPWDEDAAAPTHSILDSCDAAVEKTIRGLCEEESLHIFILKRDARMPEHGRWIEAGCSALNMVLQANALGLDVDASVVNSGRVLVSVDVG